MSANASPVSDYRIRMLSSHNIAAAALADMLQANPGLSPADAAHLLMRALFPAAGAVSGSARAIRIVRLLCAEMAPEAPQ